MPRTRSGAGRPCSIASSRRSRRDHGPAGILRDPVPGRAAPVTFSNVGYFWNTSTLDLDPTQWGTGTSDASTSAEHVQRVPRGETRTPSRTSTRPPPDPPALSGFLTGITSAIRHSARRPHVQRPGATAVDLVRRQLGMPAFPLGSLELVQKALEGDRCRSSWCHAGGAGRGAGTFLLEDFFKAPIQGH